MMDISVVICGRRLLGRVQGQCTLLDEFLILLISLQSDRPHTQGRSVGP